MSVHNAVGASYSIARADPTAQCALAGGPATIEAAFCEAAGLLADGAAEVMVVAYDLPLPELYAPYRDEPEAPYAWACRLRRGALALSCSADRGAAIAPGRLPHGLEVLRFLIGACDELVLTTGLTRWRWHRDA